MSGENAIKGLLLNDAINLNQFIDNIKQLEVCLAEAHAAKNDLMKHLEKERAEITKVTRINQELQATLRKQTTELSTLRKTNGELKQDLKNIVKENADLSKRNRLISDKLEQERTLCITSSRESLELEDKLKWEQNKNKRATSENRELSMELAILKDELKDAENNIEKKVKEALERGNETLLTKHLEEIKAMQMAYEEEQVRAGINAAADIKVAEARAKFYFDETQELCVKIKTLDTGLAKSKDETQKCIDDLKKKELELGKAKKEIENINHAKDLLQRELKEVEEKQIYEWAEYEEERNAELLMIKQEMEQLEKMTKSKMSIKKRPSTRRELIKSVCTKLEVRLGASLE